MNKDTHERYTHIQINCLRLQNFLGENRSHKNCKKQYNLNLSYNNNSS